MKYQFVKTHRKEFNLGLMCKVLEVSKSGYYDWLDRPTSDKAKGSNKLLITIRKIFQDSRGCYGYRKVYKQLQNSGIACSINTVASIMHRNNMFSKVKKKFKATTNSNHNFPVAENILDRKFVVNEPNRCWVGDISYIWTQEGWLYLATVIDLYSRTVVGWSVSDRMTTALVEDAFLKAIWNRNPDRGLIFHSDRGSQYASKDFQRLLKNHGACCSMSRKANCWDNAVAESFFKIIKSELIYHNVYRTREEARASIFEYIETFYNCKRIHSSLGYMSPMQFEKAA